MELEDEASPELPIAPRSIQKTKNAIREFRFGTSSDTINQNFRVPLSVRVDAMLPETLEFLKIANSLDTMVAPADTFDSPLKAFELHRLAPMMKEKLPPPT